MMPYSQASLNIDDAVPRVTMVPKNSSNPLSYAAKPQKLLNKSVSHTANFNNFGK